MARGDQARGAQRRSAGRRAEYVALLAEVLLEAGRTDLVLRELAASVDTSHRVLLYYFTSRDDLEVAVLRHLADAEREALIALSGSGRSDTLRRVWGYLAEPRQLQLERLSLDVMRQAQQGSGRHADLAREANAQLLEIVRVQEVTIGAPPAKAAAHALLAVGLLRGLQHQVLLGGDPAAARAALEDFIEML